MSINAFVHRCAAVVLLCCVPWIAATDQLSADEMDAGQGTRVEIFDHGLGTPIHTLTLPPGWRVNQHIATDVNDVWRMYSTYVVDFFGPSGEVSTALFPVAVYPSMGEDWEQVWLQLFDERVGRLGSFQVGPTVQSELAPQLFPKAYAAGIPVLEKSVAGTLQGAPVEGKLFALIGETQVSLIMYPSVVLAPQGRMPETIAALAGIARSQIDHPEYTAKSQQIMRQRLQIHQQLMQSRQDWFNAHMASMRQASQMRSQSNEQFSARLRSSGTSPGDPGYTTNDQFTDHLRDSTTFLDPYTGDRITQLGRHEYWFTDSLGNYYGTDDPNFEPSMLDGDWSAITPLDR